MAAPDEMEIQQQADEAMALKADGENPYPGASWIDGVEHALAWVIGERDDAPLSNEDDD